MSIKPEGPVGSPFKGPEMRTSGGRPPLDHITPLVDVSHIKRSFLDVSYGKESKEQAFDIFLPDEGEGPFPLLIHIHGGGFALGNKRDGHIKTLLHVLDKGYALASINYRLSDEAIFPAAVLDVRNCLRFIRRNAALFKIDSSRIATIGGSAGGNLSAMLAMEIPNGQFPGEEKKSFNETPYIKTAIDWFGPTDFKKMDEQAEKNGVSFTDHNKPYSAESGYLGQALDKVSSKEAIKANPMTYISERMCPLLVEHGRMDRLVPFQQSEIFVHAIQEKVGADRVKFVPLDKADHEDKEFDSDENMAVVYSWLKENL